jgi:hypothetical protein
VAALRSAFAQTLKDAGFLEDAQKQGGGYTSFLARRSRSWSSAFYASPKAVIDRPKAVVEP